MNGKTDGFTFQDFNQCANTALLKRGRAKAILEEVTEVVSTWKTFANDGDVSKEWAKEIAQKHRLKSVMREV